MPRQWPLPRDRCRVELIGGADGIGRRVVETAIAHKKHVVTPIKR